MKIFYSFKIGELSDGNEENKNIKHEENDIYPKILSDRITYKDFELDLKKGIISHLPKGLT